MITAIHQHPAPDLLLRMGKMDAWIQTANVDPSILHAHLMGQIRKNLAKTCKGKKSESYLIMSMSFKENFQ